MKITIAYLPAEEREATTDLAALQRLHPTAETKRSDRHPPHRLIYISTNRIRTKEKP